MKPRILLTALDAPAPAVSSAWLALIEVTKHMPAEIELRTRRYPAQWQTVRSQLEHDLTGDISFAIHLAQNPDATALQLERIGLNIAPHVILSNAQDATSERIDTEAPLAMQSSVPMEGLAERLRAQEIPCWISHHAGVGLANALLFSSLWLAERQGLPTRSLLVHLPLTVAQAVEQTPPAPSLPIQQMYLGVDLIVRELAASAAP